MAATQNRLKNKILIGDSNPQRGEPGQLFFNTTDKNYYYWDGTSWRTSISGVSAFTDLSDVPHSYTGQALKVVRVNSTETGLEFSTVVTTDEKVKADNTDPTPGFLDEKVDGTTINVDTINHKIQVVPGVFSPIVHTHTKSDITDFVESDYVHTTGDENISGVKTFLSFPITPSSAPSSDYEVANKKYVDDNAGSTTFIGLTDTPNSYAGQSLKYVRVNSTENGLEFATVDTLDEKVKADAGDPTSGFLSEKVDGNSIKVGADHKMYVDPTYLQGFFISKTGDSIGPGPYTYDFKVNEFDITADTGITLLSHYSAPINLFAQNGMVSIYSQGNEVRIVSDATQGVSVGAMAGNLNLLSRNGLVHIEAINGPIVFFLNNSPVAFFDQADSSLDMMTHKIKNLQDPTDPQDAATKHYVDTHGGGAPGGSNEQIQYNNAGVFGGAEVYYKAAQKLLGIDTSSPAAKVHVRRSSGDVAKTLIVDDIETESSTVVEEKGATYIRKIIRATYTYRTQQNYTSLILPLPPGLFYPISGVWGYNYGFVREVLVDGSPIWFSELDSSWQNGRPTAPGQFAYGGFAWAVQVNSVSDNAQVTVKMEVRELIDSIKGLRVARSYSPDPGAVRSYEYAVRNATDTVLDTGKWDDHPPATYPDEGVYWTYPISSDYGIFVFRLKPKLSAGYYNHGSKYMIHIGKEWRHYKVYPSQTEGLGIREIFGNSSYRAAKLAIFHYPTGAISRLSAETLIYKYNARARTKGWSRTIVLR